mgnify:CR=1 FL=1
MISPALLANCFGKLSVNGALYKLHNGIFDVSETRINTKSFPRRYPPSCTPFPRVSGAESNNGFCFYCTGAFPRDSGAESGQVSTMPLIVFFSPR